MTDRGPLRDARQSVPELLATAVILNERKLREITARKGGGWLKVVKHKFYVVLTAVGTHSLSLTTKQWASFLLLASIVRPWAQPLAQALWHTFVEHAKSQALAALRSGGWSLARVLAAVLSKLQALAVSAITTIRFDSVADMFTGRAAVPAPTLARAVSIGQVTSTLGMAGDGGPVLENNTSDHRAIAPDNNVSASIDELIVTCIMPLTMRGRCHRIRRHDCISHSLI